MTLDKLRDDENLYQDVWISPNEEQIVPRWLVKPQVKQAIKALHCRFSLLPPSFSFLSHLYLLFNPYTNFPFSYLL